MTTEQLVIALVRIAGSLPVLRWPFYGALLAIAVDLADLPMMDALHLGGVPNYQAFDKALDLVYMTTFLAVALRWRGLERSIAVVLFAYRMLGVAAFEVTGHRELMLVFPNVFEFWFVVVAARERAARDTAAPLDHHVPDHHLSTRRALLWLLALTSMKEAQEYILHYARWLDRYTFFEFWAVLWRALTSR